MKALDKLFLSGVLKVLAGRNDSSRLAVLIYHRVMRSPDPMRPGEPTVDQFAAHMKVIKNHFDPLPLSEALELLSIDALPDRAVSVTFDDGYSDNEELALPVLREYGIDACVFVATKFLNGGTMWNDRVIEGVRTYQAHEIDLRDFGLDRYALGSQEQRLAAAQSILLDIKHKDPSEREKVASHVGSESNQNDLDLMLTTDQLKNLVKAGIEIGGHTHSHPILSSLNRESSREDIVRGKEELEKVIGKPVRFFAYPNGRPMVDYGVDHVEIIKDLGFDAAFSTHWGAADKNTDRFQIPRFTPWDRTDIRYAMRLAHNYRNIK